MRKNAHLTRKKCFGIVDADDYGEKDTNILGELGIAILPVSEIENVIVLPDVSRAIAETEGYQDTELEEILTQLSVAIFETLNAPEKIEMVVLRYCRRRIDRMLKKVDLSEARTIDALEDEYRTRTEALNIRSIAQHATEQINQAIAEQNLPKLLAQYDNKELIAVAASKLKKCRMNDFESWLTRMLRNNSVPFVSDAILSQLPEIRTE